MSLLAPLFLLGALAVGLPIVFHLIRRSSRDKVEFGSLMFLQPSPPRLTRRSRLEHLILLLLRCVVICLLALAFARPFFQKPVLANSPPDNGRKIIVLVDTSASMRREGVWAAALDKAGEVLRKTSPADPVAVFTFDTQTHQVVSFEQWSQMNPAERATLAGGQLAQIKPGWFGTHLGAALLAAAETFTDADKQARNLGPQRIVLISDLQEGSRLDGLQGYDWPRGTDVQIERIAPRRPTNAGLQWVADTADSSKTASDAPARVRVINSANAQREQFQLHWEGVPSALPLDIYVPPGQSRIIEAPKLPTNTAGEQLVLTGDDDPFDNTVFLLRPKAEQISVLYSGDEAETNTTQPLFYLKRAFQQTKQEDVKIIAHAGSAPFESADLAKARLFIATGPLGDERIASARTFLTNGGTLLFVARNGATVESLGRLVGVEGLTADEVTATNYAMLGLVDFGHPLFAPFSDPRYNDFTKIHFWKYRRLDAARFADGRILARFDSGDPALIEVPKGKGRLLILFSGWRPADSQLALSSKFVPLLYSILDLAGGIHAPVAQFQVGQSVDLAQFGVVPGDSRELITIQKPDGNKVTLATSETKFAQTDQPGIYTVGSTQPLGRFAVNLDPAESRTAPLPFDQLERLGIPLKPREVEWAKQAERKQQLHAAELENQQKLWRWLTLAAVVVLLGETWLAGWLTRRVLGKAEVAT